MFPRHVAPASAVATLAPILLFIAGCVGPGDSPCDGFALPRTHGGDAFVFAAEGQFLTLQGPSVVDWSLAGVANATREPLLFRSGDRMRVDVSNATGESLNVLGQAEPTSSARFSAVRANASILLFREERLSADDLNLVQLVHSNIEALAGKVEHSVRYTLHGHPPLLHAPLLWDRPLSRGDRFDVVAPAEMHTVRDGPPDGYLRLEVTKTFQESIGGRMVCAARLRMDFGLALGAEVVPLQGQMEVREGVPLPTFFELSIPPNKLAPDPTLRLRLESFVPGANDSLPAFLPRSEIPTQAPERLANTPDGFPSGDSSFMGTSYEAARGAAVNAPEVRAWLDVHNDSVLAEVRHKNGSRDAGVVDMWQLQWRSPSGSEALTATVHSALQEDGSTRLQVTNETRTGRFEVSSRPASNIVRMDFLQDLSRRLYGRDPEALHCYVLKDWCSGGTHETTLEPRADSNAAAFYRSGIVVWLSRGWLLQETSYAEPS